MLKIRVVPDGRITAVPAVPADETAEKVVLLAFNHERGTDQDFFQVLILPFTRANGKYISSPTPYWWSLAFLCQDMLYIDGGFQPITPRESGGLTQTWDGVNMDFVGYGRQSMARPVVIDNRGYSWGLDRDLLSSAIDSRVKSKLKGGIW